MDRRWSLAALRAIIFAAVLLVSGASGAGAVAPAPAQGPVSCAIQKDDVAVRFGPGDAYPSQGVLPKGLRVRAVSFVAAGVPNGKWVEIELSEDPGTSIGFVKLEDPAIKCNPGVNLLPTSVFPPQNAQLFEALDRVQVDGGGEQEKNLRAITNEQDGRYIYLPGVDPKQAQAVQNANGTLLFDDAFGFGVEVSDRRRSRTDGDGIQKVQFTITYFDEETDQDDVIAYDHTENAPPFCVFGNDSDKKTCNVYHFSKLGYRWPGGKARPMGVTDYTATIIIFAKTGESTKWTWRFRMSGRPVQFP